MSKFVGFIVGAALVVAGVLTGNVALIIQGGAMIVSNAVLLLTMPKAPARQASEMTLQLGEQPRCALFGETFTAGTLVDAFNMGGKYGTNWEFLIIRLADHPCDSLVGFFVNDEFYEYEGDGVVPAFDEDGDGDLEIYFRGDTTNQELRESVYTYGPGWDEADQGEAGCDIVVAYQADEPGETGPEWPGGRPRFGFVVRGKKCYDPRLDSTVDGGSGTHRWDDPSTWEWSDNPAVCRYNWARGVYANDQVSDPTQLLVGRGLSEAEAPPENIFAAANLCDELVDGEKRYRVAGPVYSTQPFLEVEEMFAAATGGSVVTREGSVELEPGAAKGVVASFTDDDLISGSQVSWNQGVLSESSGEWVNTVVARYVEPTQHWRDHAAPVIRSSENILSDGKPRETSITLRLVAWSAQAQRVAEITRRLGRLWGRAQVTLGPRFCELEDGDWINWTSARRFGGATKTFRVEAYSLDAKWHNTLTLREITETVYGEAAFLEDYSDATLPPPPPEIGAPDPGNWELTAVTLNGDTIPALHIEGDAGDDEYVTQIIFEYWQSDGIIDPVANPNAPAWVTAGSLPATTTQLDISSVVGGATYYAAVTYVVDGEPGDRLILGPVTVAHYSEIEATAVSFAFLERTAANNATQGVAFDGTYLYATGGINQPPDEQWTLTKYDLYGNTIATRNVGADGDAAHTQINGLWYYPDDGKIYASATNYLVAEGTSQSNPRSWVLVYDTDLNFISTTELGAVIGEHLCPYDGHWWQVAWDVHEIWRYDASFAFVAAYELPDSDPGIGAWQGIFEIDDVFYLNLHESNADPNPFRAYRWNGAQFAVETTTETRPSTYCTQGNYFDGEHIWWAERITVGTDILPNGEAYIVKTRAFPPAVVTETATDAILLSGDMQTGTDRLLLSGDMQVGADVELQTESI